MSKKSERKPIDERIFLDRKEILKVDDIDVIDHYVDEWKSWVRIKIMTSKERQSFQKRIREARPNGAPDAVPDNMMETLIILCVVDDDRQPMFKSSDIANLAEKNSQALASIFAKAAEINGLTAGAVEDAAKN